MNKLSNLFWVSLGLLGLLTSVANAQPITPSGGGQKLCVRSGNTTTTDCGPSPVTSTQSNFTFSFLDATPPTVSNTEAGSWYKAFWITGDGNYLKRGTVQTTYQFDQGLASLNYTYPEPGSYHPVVYLTEKYNNSEPPDKLTRTVTAGGPSAAAVDLMPQLTNSRKIALDFNHSPRPDYPMVFAVSFDKKVVSPIEVLFLYNGFKTAPNTTTATTSMVSYVGADLPNYFTSNSPVFAEQPINRLATDYPGTNLSAAFSGQYSNYLRFNLSGLNASLIPAGFQELRIFPQLKTASLSRMPGGRIPVTPLSFTAILIAKEPLSDNDPYFKSLILEVEQILKGGSFSLGSLGNIVGIAQVDIPISASHDPNALKVTNVQDAGSGEFLVTFLLKICNEGEILERSPKVNVKDLTGGLFRRLELKNRPDSVLPTSNNWAFQLVNLDIPPVPKPYSPQYKTVEFTMITNSAGLQTLMQSDPKVIETCVEFTSGLAGNLTCCQNDTITSNDFKDPSGKYERIKPVDETCTCCGFNLLQILLIGIALLLFLMRVFRRI